MDTRDAIKAGKRFAILPKYNYVENETARQVQAFAQAEWDASYTLDDFISTLEYAWLLESDESGHSRVFWGNNNRWWIFFYHNYNANDYTSEFTWSSMLLERWLLTEAEVNDPLRTPPDKLTKRLREQAKSNPDEFRERLRRRTPDLAHLHDSPHFGIVEREI